MDIYKFKKILLGQKINDTKVNIRNYTNCRRENNREYTILFEILLKKKVVKMNAYNLNNEFKNFINAYQNVEENFKDKGYINKLYPQESRWSIYYLQMIYEYLIQYPLSINLNKEITYPIYFYNSSIFANLRISIDDNIFINSINETVENIVKILQLKNKIIFLIDPDEKICIEIFSNNTEKVLEEVKKLEEHIEKEIQKAMTRIF